MKSKSLLYSIFAIYKYSTKQNRVKIFNSNTIKQLDKDVYLQLIEEKKEALVIDLRTPFEYNMSHHPRAININYLMRFKEKISKLDTNKPVFICCETAHRSPYATLQLKEVGFTEIYDLKKGYSQIRSIIKQNLV